MSFELMRGDPMAAADARELRRFSLAASSIMGLAGERGDISEHEQLREAVMDRTEPQRLLCSRESVKVYAGLALPRHVWLAEDRVYADTAALVEMVEWDLQLFRSVRSSNEVLRGAITMLGRVVRGSETRPIVRTRGHALTWTRDAEWPTQDGGLAYAPLGTSEVYFSTNLGNGEGLIVGEANGWLERFNKYIHR